MELLEQTVQQVLPLVRIIRQDINAVDGDADG